MNPRDFLAKQKIHLFFGGGFLLVLALNFTIGFSAGQSFLGATWQAFREIGLMDYVMFGLFWYACAVHPPRDDWDSTLITLNLSRSTNRK